MPTLVKSQALDRYGDRSILDQRGHLQQLGVTWFHHVSPIMLHGFAWSIAMNASRVLHDLA